MKEIKVSKLIRALLITVHEPEKPLYKINFILFLNDMYAGTRSDDKLSIKYLKDIFDKYKVSELTLHNESTLKHFDHDNYMVLSAKINDEQLIVLLIDRIKYKKTIDTIMA